MKTVTKKKKEPRQSLKAVLKNTRFALQVIHRAAPGFLLVSGFANALGGFRDALTNVILLRYAVNAAQRGESFSQIAGVVLLCFAVHLALSIVLNYISPYFGQNSPYFEKNALKISVYIDKMLMDKARTVDLSAYEEPEAYESYFKAREDSYGHILSVYWVFVQFTFRLTNLSISAWVIFSIDPTLALFVLIPCISAFLFTRADKLNYNADQEKKKCRRARDYALRTFYLADYVKELRTGGFAALMKERFLNEVERQDAIIRRYAPRLTLLNYAAAALQEIILPMGAIAYAIWQALGTGRILYGDCLVVINSISAVSWGIIALFDNLIWLLKESRYIQNVVDFLGIKVKIADRADAKPVRRGDLEFRNVTFTYPGASSPTLKNLSFRVADGEKIALVGQNGAGKTTIAKLMLRLYDPDEGEILYGGTDIRELRLADYRAAFAVVFQDFKNFSTNIAENVLLHPEGEGDRARVRAAVEKAGFAAKADSLPQGLDTRLTREFDENGVNLSGGEAQKLSIARIYAKEASAAILDEPTSALDPLAEYQMYENMMDACRTRSVVFISHRLSSAVLADRVILLENGSVAETGPHAALMAAGGKYAAMFAMQAEKYRESEVRADD